MPSLSGIIARERETSILKRLQSRDPSALGELYDLYGRLSYSSILRIVRSPATAEDLVQETFLRVWTRAHQLDPVRTSVGPWLLTIARNRALDHLRAPSHWDRVSALRLEQTEDPKLFANLERDVLNAENLEALRRELSKLRPSQKMAIELAYFEGRSQSEMAEYFGQPLGTIKTLVRSALIHLRAALDGANSDLHSSRLRPPVVNRPDKAEIDNRMETGLRRACDIDRDGS